MHDIILWAFSSLLKCHHTNNRPVRQILPVPTISVVDVPQKQLIRELGGWRVIGCAIALKEFELTTKMIQPTLTIYCSRADNDNEAVVHSSSNCFSESEGNEDEPQQQKQSNDDTVFHYLKIRLCLKHNHYEAISLSTIYKMLNALHYAILWSFSCRFHQTNNSYVSFFDVKALLCRYLQDEFTN